METIGSTRIEYLTWALQIVVEATKLVHKEGKCCVHVPTVLGIGGQYNVAGF